MSGHTRRLTQSPTRTTPGSYEAPVEGIVDYGAFSKGFEKGIAPGLAYLAENAKEEEMPDLITLEDFDYTGTASKSGALGVSTEASNSMNLGIDNKIRDIQARLDSAVIRKDVNLQRDIMKEYNTLKKVVAGAQMAFNGIAGGEGAIDARQARNIKIGRNADGEGLSWYDISTIGNQKDSAFEFVTNANGTGGLRVNGYYFDTTSINENSVSKITPLLGGLDAALKSYQSESPLAKMQRTKGITKQGLTEKTTSKITDDSYKNIDTKAAGFAKTIVENTATKNANLLDFMYGENKNVGGEPSLFMQSLVDNKEFGEGKTFEQISELISTANNSLTPEQLKEKVEISTKILTLGAENEYKLNIASEAYVIDPETGRAIRRDDLVNKKQLDPDDDGGGGFSINFGGRNLDDDLLKRTRELLSITSIQTNDQGVITPASRDNVIAYIAGQDLNFETNKKGTQELVAGKIDGVTSDMVTITSRKITTGPDKGKTKAVISIQPKPQVLVEGGSETEFEPIEYDLTQESDIEKLLANQYGFATDKGKKFKAQYDPVLDYLKALRRGLINEDGTPVPNPLMEN